jgi:hypothetical protein
MSAVDTLVELDIRTDAHAPARVARVHPEALIQIVRSAVSVNGAVWIRVTGKSMNPIIRQGDRVLITALRRVPARGAVVLIDAEGIPLLHRVVRMRGGSVITKGDNRRLADPPQPLTAVVGRAMLVRRGGTPICLAPTLEFGFLPLLRAVAWWARVRSPRTWMQRHHRGDANAA